MIEVLALLLGLPLICDPQTDIGPAWAAAIEEADAGDYKTIVLPGGACRTWGPLAPIRRGVNVVGQGKSWSGIECNTNGTCVQVCDQGSRLSDFYISKGAGYFGGSGLAVTACGGRPAGNHNIERIWITSLSGGGIWGYSLYIDGSERTQAPVGMRAVTLNDVTVFNAASWLAVIWNCISCEWRGGGAYQGAGNARGIAVGGGGWSQNIRLDIVYDRAASTVYQGSLR